MRIIICIVLPTRHGWTRLTMCITKKTGKENNEINQYRYNVTKIYLKPFTHYCVTLQAICKIKQFRLGGGVWRLGFGNNWQLSLKIVASKMTCIVSGWALNSTRDYSLKTELLAITDTLPFYENSVQTQILRQKCWYFVRSIVHVKNVHCNSSILQR